MAALYYIVWARHNSFNQNLIDGQIFRWYKKVGMVVDSILLTFLVVSLTKS